MMLSHTISPLFASLMAGSMPSSGSGFVSVSSGGVIFQCFAEENLARNAWRRCTYYSCVSSWDSSAS
jgi:hypothetical protein